jgi:hypothetical protein
VNSDCYHALRKASERATPILSWLRLTEFAWYIEVMADLNENLARLTSVQTEMEAGVIVAGLQDRGIQATMSGVYTAHFRAEAPGWVEVLVAEHDLPAAQAILAEVRREHREVDWADVDVGEPDGE